MDPMWVRDDECQPGAASGTDGILGAARYQRHHHTRGAVHDLVVAPVIPPTTTNAMSRNMSHNVIEEYVDGPAYGRTVHHRVLRIGTEHTPVVTTIITTHMAIPPSPPTMALMALDPRPALTSRLLVDTAVRDLCPLAPPAQLERATYG